MRRIVVTTATLTLVAALAGCRIGGSPPAATASHSSPAASAPAASVTDDQITAWVDRAGPSQAAVGADKVEEHKGVYAVPVPCPTTGGTIENVVWTHAWYWTGGPIGYLVEQVVGISAPAARFQVAVVKGYAHQCQTYQSSDSADTYTVTIAGDYPLTAPDGVDGAFAWCEEYTQLTPAEGAGQKSVACQAVFSRGPLMMRLLEYGNLATVASARAKLDLAITLTVKAFVAAVPST